MAGGKVNTSAALDTGTKGQSRFESNLSGSSTVRLYRGVAHWFSHSNHDFHSAGLGTKLEKIAAINVKQYSFVCVILR